MKVLVGGNCDGREGWFVQPTVLTTEDPMVRHMKDEFFGPIVTLHVYPDNAWVVRFREGDIAVAHRGSNLYYVRAVRSGT